MIDKEWLANLLEAGDDLADSLEYWSDEYLIGGLDDELNRWRALRNNE